MSRADHEGYVSTLKDVVHTVREGGVPIAVVLTCGHRLNLPPHRLMRGALRFKCLTCDLTSYKREGKHAKKG